MAHHAGRDGAGGAGGHVGAAASSLVGRAPGGALELSAETAQAVAVAAGDLPVSFVTVMGEARVGKSTVSSIFLTDAAAWPGEGAAAPFRVSPLRASCTQGMDVGTPPLIARGASGSGDRAVVWGDLEGSGVDEEGDRVHLPAAAVAHAVVFIVREAGGGALGDALNPIVRAIEQLRAGQAVVGPPQTRLYLVIREWDADGAGGRRFDAEYAAEQWRRIRADMSASDCADWDRVFGSVTVWPMPPVPTRGADVAAARAAYVARVRQLRARVLADVLASPPARVAGLELTGRALPGLLRGLVGRVNAGAAAAVSLFDAMQDAMSAAAVERTSADATDALRRLQSTVADCPMAPARLRDEIAAAVIPVRQGLELRLRAGGVPPHVQATTLARWEAAVRAHVQAACDNNARMLRKRAEEAWAAVATVTEADARVTGAVAQQERAIATARPPPGRSDVDAMLEAVRAVVNEVAASQLRVTLATPKFAGLDDSAPRRGPAPAGVDARVVDAVLGRVGYLAPRADQVRFLGRAAMLEALLRSGDLGDCLAAIKQQLNGALDRALIALEEANLASASERNRGAVLQLRTQRSNAMDLARTSLLHPDQRKLLDDPAVVQFGYLAAPGGSYVEWLRRAIFCVAVDKLVRAAADDAMREDTTCFLLDRAWDVAVLFPQEMCDAMAVRSIAGFMADVMGPGKPAPSARRVRFARAFSRMLVHLLGKCSLPALEAPDLENMLPATLASVAREGAAGGDAASAVNWLVVLGHTCACHPTPDPIKRGAAISDAVVVCQRLRDGDRAAALAALLQLVRRAQHGASPRRDVSRADADAATGALRASAEAWFSVAVANMGARDTEPAFAPACGLAAAALRVKPELADRLTVRIATSLVSAVVAQAGDGARLPWAAVGDACAVLTSAVATPPVQSKRAALLTALFDLTWAMQEAADIPAGASGGAGARPVSDDARILTQVDTAHSHQAACAAVVALAAAVCTSGSAEQQAASVRAANGLGMVDAARALQDAMPASQPVQAAVARLLRVLEGAGDGAGGGAA